jgi:hypothetical protein
MKTSEKEHKFRFLKAYAKLLDEQFTLPFFNFKFGIDPLLSLIPFIGSFAGFISGFIFVLLSLQLGAEGKVIILMLRNIFIDFLVGEIPVLGQLGDFVIKANERNYKLIEAHYFEGKHKGSGIGIIIGLLLFLLLFILGAVYLFIKFISQFSNFILSLF